MGNRFSQHSFTTSWRSIHEHTTWWVYTDLLIKVKVRKRQLYGFPYFLFLYVHTTDIRVGYIRLLVCVIQV